MESISDNTTTQNQPEPHHLSNKETRQIVTPYAFHVSPELFGTALARPKKRVIAIGIDMLLVAILSQSAGFLLAGVAAVTFFRAGNRLKLKKRFNAARLGLRFIAASMLFVFAFGIFDEYAQENKPNELGSKISKEITKSGADTFSIVGLTASYMVKAGSLMKKVDNKECVPAYDCWHELGDELVDKIADINMPVDEAMDVVEGVMEFSDDSLTKDEQKTMFGEWRVLLEQAKIAQEPQLSAQNTATQQQATVDQVSKPELEQPIEKTEKDKKTKKSQKNTDDEDDEDNSSSGIVAWGKSLLEDLGIGFGWAAFYFSIFTSWWKGQTPGKKLLGIKVIKLDGSTPTLWESFGRYGGYGAGFATGLLGFLQVYWDPNRQAIQDKISETLVIDLRIPKVNFIPEHNNHTGTEL
ncbi:RDD family protein [Paraglaciecola sp.]|uniref:RDD family protein n=1 Tax=Paraglaciecola sp. TaxID=1920173 RepID=UPI0030F420AB